MKRRMITVDGNTACAQVVHATNEIITIYPITPSSPIAELCDAKSAAKERNIWGSIPLVSQMQSEAGVAGAVHGSLTTGAVTATISASQGLLLLIPNMYKIAGELTPTVFHITARSLSTQALCIFGDHSDVMAARSTGFAMLCAKNVQEAMDFALISQAAALEARVPFIHFFDGFRTSHEVQKIEELTLDDMRAMIDNDLVLAHRARGLTPDSPRIRGTAQNPDVYFQGRETVNPFYQATPGVVQKMMDRFAALTGRHYKLFDYFGAPDAERIVVVMGSAGETVESTIDMLNAEGARLGLLQVALYRPFDVKEFASALPATTKAIAVLDRTKEPGALGEPLYIDVRTALGEAMEQGFSAWSGYPRVVGGRYGLGSKDFTPAMAKAVYDNLAGPSPKNHFTVGIDDDVTGSSLSVEESFRLKDKAFCALFYGLGADGTVGANKNTIKIIGKETENYAQGYFAYDSKKSGSMTISHLRFGKDAIHSPYLLSNAGFVACHNESFLEKYDMLAYAEEGATFLLTTSRSKDKVWDSLPPEAQNHLIDKKMRLYVIDAVILAEQLGLGARINMIMQTAFFVISGIIPKEDAVKAIKKEIHATYAKKGEKVLEKNYAAVDRAIDSIVEVPVPDKATSTVKMRPAVPEHAPQFVRDVTARMIEGKGDSLPVSAIPADGTWPTGTTQYEKRNIAVHIPVWDPETCIQCGSCSFVCPHAAIRIKAYDATHLKDAPAAFKSADAKGKELKGLKFTVQVAPEDCTGCGSCIFMCPAVKKDAAGNKTDVKAINMGSQETLRRQEAENFSFFLALPETDPALYNPMTVKGSQFVRPLFEFNGACAGCGETPYIKLLTQLFGDRLLIGNATGCSSIYGGNLPTTPYCSRADGRGPAWSNSLFEDAAEFAFGMRLTVDTFRKQALEAMGRVAVGERYIPARRLFDEIISADQSTQAGIETQRRRVEELKKLLGSDDSFDARSLGSLADYLVRKSVWGVGGDGWGYDIGFGGVDQVMASGEDVNLLILDTEVYSNTGGQMSKSTPLAATAQFAAAGKRTPKKNIGAMMIPYGNVYIAQVAFGANPAQTVRAMHEAESFNGPSLVIAYSSCIGQGLDDMARAVDYQRRAVACGHWPLFRYNPRLEAEGKNPLVLDSAAPTIPYAEYAYTENRFQSLKRTDPEEAPELMKRAQAFVDRRWNYLKHLAAWSPDQR
jgi:pyruvate-ferredoxin/flavodoxin oxidoreductase